ncbi:MAG: tRNA (adenosine(37)-N6)-threonylcarbamoyltransferase complex dimerization subunit type 1 TsaB [Acidobacteriota bacterium]|nr:tRNA (adenosine(37)-N6)-threonylcarbamoyltransferase complex dimerization subunit type 1 TsaB [Acidobacteriota bacterium]
MNEGPVILSVETATRGGSIFLARGVLQLAARVGDPNISHSNNLLTDINDTLEGAGLSLEDVEVFACASGPGSFTGLRIGIATVKALAATLQRPSVGIPTLQAVAHTAGASPATVAVLPAGRGEVFAQMFSVAEDDTVTKLDEAAHLSPQRLIDRYGVMRKLIWAGSGVLVQQDLLRSYAAENRIPFLEESSLPPDDAWVVATNVPNLARHVSALALHAFRRDDLQSAQALRAIYVRPSDAELKQQCR